MKYDSSQLIDTLQLHPKVTITVLSSFTEFVNKPDGKQHILSPLEKASFTIKSSEIPNEDNCFSTACIIDSDPFRPHSSLGG